MQIQITPALFFFGSASQLSQDHIFKGSSEVQCRWASSRVAHMVNPPTVASCPQPHLAAVTAWLLAPPTRTQTAGNRKWLSKTCQLDEKTFSHMFYLAISCRCRFSYNHSPVTEERREYFKGGLSSQWDPVPLWPRCRCEHLPLSSTWRRRQPWS